MGTLRRGSEAWARSRKGVRPKFEARIGIPELRFGQKMAQPLPFGAMEPNFDIKRCRRHRLSSEPQPFESNSDESVGALAHSYFRPLFPDPDRPPIYEKIPRACPPNVPKECAQLPQTNHVLARGKACRAHCSEHDPSFERGQTAPMRRPTTAGVFPSAPYSARSSSHKSLTPCPCSPIWSDVCGITLLARPATPSFAPETEAQ